MLDETFRVFQTSDASQRPNHDVALALRLHRVLDVLPRAAAATAFRTKIARLNWGRNHAEARTRRNHAIWRDFVDLRNDTARKILAIVGDTNLRGFVGRAAQCENRLAEIVAPDRFAARREVAKHDGFCRIFSLNFFGRHGNNQKKRPGQKPSLSNGTPSTRSQFHNSICPFAQRLNELVPLTIVGEVAVGFSD